MISFRKRLSIFMLVFLLLCPRNTNSIGLLAITLSIGIPVLLSLPAFYEVLIGGPRRELAEVNTKVTVVDGKVTEVDRKVTVIDEKLTVVDEKTTKISQDVIALQGTVNNFDKKTDQNFIEVKSEVVEARVTLMNELLNKEKILSDIIKNTEQNIRQESQENYKNLRLEIEGLKQDIKTFATKEDLKENLDDLKKSIKVIDEKINNLKNEIKTSMSELRNEIKEDSKQQLECKLGELNVSVGNEIAVIKKFYERMERQNGEARQEIGSLRNEIGDLRHEVKIIGTDIREVRSIIMGKKPVVAV